ncbi:hypothetical protein B0H16DRAFT_1628672, partial [Mycena metata]
MLFKSILFLNILNLQHFVQCRSIPSTGCYHVPSRSRRVIISLGGRTYGSLTTGPSTFDTVFNSTSLNCQRALLCSF